MIPVVGPTREEACSWVSPSICVYLIIYGHSAIDGLGAKLHGWQITLQAVLCSDWGYIDRYRELCLKGGVYLDRG